MKILFFFTLWMTGLMPVGQSGQDKTETATLAGGCFWCLEGPFHKLPGVVDVKAGYAGGKKPNPSYEEVSTGASGYVEAVQITYDPGKIGFERLLDVFWRQIDPTDDGGQFADRGPQYRTAIFYHDEHQKAVAEQSIRRLEASGKFSRPVATEIRPYTTFYVAEEPHQDYYRKQPERYGVYSERSGRKPFLRKTWTASKPKETP
jgi:methionine-S-sulfoxide reductase